MINAYFISGLGADERAFRHIRLPAGYRPVHLHWIAPRDKEPLPEYALRMAEYIDPSQPFVLIGLSLGGMVATEIAHHFPPTALILISSIPSSAHLPFYFRAAGATGLHRLVPIRLLQNVSLVKRFFTTETDEDRALLRQMIRESDPAFIRWAVRAILTWEKKEAPMQLFQIHGGRDWLLPRRYTHPQYLLPDAGHLMVLNRPAEINRILEEVLLS